LYTRRERVKKQQNTKHEITYTLTTFVGPNPIAFPVDNQNAINKSDPMTPHDPTYTSLKNT